MKYILVVTLLLGVLGLGSCTRSSHSKLSWLTQKWLKTVEGHEDHWVNERHKRIAALNLPHDCYNEVIRQVCQNGLAEQFVLLNLKCGYKYIPKKRGAQCDKNAAGEECVVHDVEALYTLISTANDICFEEISFSGFSASGDSCPSEECANSLQAVRNSPAGCCVSTLYNGTFRTSNFQFHDRQRFFDYTLWSQCGVETIEPCEEIIARAPLPDVTPYTQCTDEEYETQFYDIQCSAKFKTILEQVEEMDGCSDEIRPPFETFCFVNSQGENCQLASNYSQTKSGIKECITDREMSCSGNCMKALEVIKNKQGCCFNFVNNFTFEDPQYRDLVELASYSLWSECGVETPPLTCRNLLLSKAHGKDLAILTLITTLLVAAMWNI